MRSSPYIYEDGAAARARSASESSADLLEEPPEDDDGEPPPPPPPPLIEEIAQTPAVAETSPIPPPLPPPPEADNHPDEHPDDSLPESEPEQQRPPLKPTSTPLYAHVVGKEFQLSSEESLNEELLRLRDDTTICPLVGQSELPTVGTSPAHGVPRSLHVQEFPVVGTSPSPDPDRDYDLLRPDANATARRVSLQVRDDICSTTKTIPEKNLTNLK